MQNENEEKWADCGGGFKGGGRAGSDPPPPWVTDQRRLGTPDK